MTRPPFGINVVSRWHTVVCGSCGATARRVEETCSSCGAAFAEGGFSIVAIADHSESAAKQRPAGAPELRPGPAS
jgi:hypothetical protein